MPGLTSPANDSEYTGSQNHDDPYQHGIDYGLDLVCIVAELDFESYHDRLGVIEVKLL